MYAILDIESTGGKYNEEGIMEIAIYRFDGENTVDRFISLVNPEREIQPFVVKLTGINNKMLRSAPKFHEVAKRIIEITQGTTLVAHNAQFDYRILRTEFRRLGYNFERKTLCTVDLSKKLLPDAESHSLGKLVRSLGIPVSDRHRANGDALATLKLFKLLLAKDIDKSIVREVVRAETLGELTKKQLDIVESLPSETGVYYMHNRDGDILFLGKTKNIKKRVNQHFTNEGQLARILQKETKKVTFERTGSELAAILKEGVELQENKPKFNKKIKDQCFSHGVYIAKDKNGILTLKAEQANGHARRLSSFNSLKASRNFLNEVLKKYQLDSLIEPEKRNELITEIEKKHSVQNRTLALLDKGRQLGEKSVFFIKNGTFQGFGYADLNHQINNIPILESIITPMKGNPNTTFIIESYLRKYKIQIVELES
ncbi:exonuclease domain-containing protein [Flavobacteriaceae bacterium GF1]